MCFEISYCNNMQYNVIINYCNKLRNNEAELINYDYVGKVWKESKNIPGSYEIFTVQVYTLQRSSKYLHHQLIRCIGKLRITTF